ncbi:MAG: hypothetical protein ACREDT_14160 [Methylocella sp.]
MIYRRPTQQEHERANVSSFVSWFNRVYRTDYKVDSEPNPPEAVLRSSCGSTCWVEVSSAFLNEDYAKDRYSFATPGEAHKPYRNRPLQEPDNNFAQRFVCVVKKKLEKQSYIPYKNKYGGGYLVVPIMNPLFNEQTFQAMKAAWATFAPTVNDLGCFSSVYILSASNDPIEFLPL